MHPASHQGQRGQSVRAAGRCSEASWFPWPCRAADPVPRSLGVEQRLSQQKPGRRVTVGRSQRDSLWSWNAAGAGGGSVPGAGVAPRRAEPSSAAGCCARMLLGCADPPTILVRGGNCAHRGCGHRGAEGSSALTCHHTGMNLAEPLLPSLGVEKSWASQTQPRAAPWQTTRQRNVTSSPQNIGEMWRRALRAARAGKKHPELQLDPAPEPAAVGARLQQLPGFRLSHPVSGSVQGSKTRVRGKGSAWEGTWTLSRLETQRDVFGGVVSCVCVPPSPCVCAQEREGLWAEGLCQAVEQGAHPTTGFGGWGFFFFSYFLQSHPRRGLRVLPALSSGPKPPLRQAATQQL